MGQLSERFENALVFGLKLHADQVRKGTGVPYVSHLMAVASLVMENGGNEDEVIAAFLHDAVEDQGGPETLEKIRELFGGNVAEIVAGCTDAWDNPKPPWRERKEKYLKHLLEAPKPVLLVSTADKLHNARTILADYRQIGAEVWSRFKGGKEGTLWYYQAIVEAYHRAEAHPGLVDELERTVKSLIEIE